MRRIADAPRGAFRILHSPFPIPHSTTWETVRHQKSAPPAEGSPAARLESLEAQVEELRGELTSASGLLATIAEQNAQLVEVVAILRVRTRVLLAVSALLVMAVLGLLAHALAQ
jgi:hypothetical protein